MKNYLLFCAIFFLIITTGGIPAYGLDINGYDCARHDRFSSGYATAPVQNPSFFASGYDWSGVGWSPVNPRQSIALISAQHFVLANHWRIPEGNTVTFLNRDGLLKSYIIDGYTSFSSGTGSTHIADLALGQLRDPIAAADNIAWYPVINADNKQTPEFEVGWYLQKEFLAYGWDARVGTNTINFFSYVNTLSGQNPDNQTLCAISDFHKTNGVLYPDEAGFIGGDSGSPSFLVWDNQLTLMATHFAISDSNPDIRVNCDSFIPYYLNDLNNAMRAQGYAATTINVIPEPLSFILFIFGIGGTLLRARKKLGQSAKAIK